MSSELEPSSAADVEQLVQRFYATTNAEERTAIDSELTRLQRRPEGFAIADQLLQSNFPEVRLYGANTFIIKIKHDLSTLDDDQRGELQARLLRWLQNSMYSAASQPVMAKKVCSAVAECFIASAGTWKSCISDVIGLFIPATASSTAPGDVGFVQDMSETDQLGVVWFTSTLVEMVGAREPDFASTNTLRRVIDMDLATVVLLISSIFTAAVSTAGAEMDPSPLINDALLCLSSLMTWTRESSDCTEAIEQLRKAMHWLIQSLANVAYFEIASSTIYEVILEYPSFLKDDHWTAIASVLLSDWAVRLLHEAEFDETTPAAVGKILLAFCEARWENLCAEPNTERDRRILECCLLALNGRGIPNVDEEVVFMAVDLFTLLIEELQLEEGPTWPNIKSELLPAAVRSIRRRVVLPPPERLRTFTQYDTDCFSSFRTCAGDFMEAAARLLDIKEVSSMFTEDARQSIQSQLWADIEADIFCLNSIISKGGYQSYGDVLPIVKSLFYPSDETPALSNALLELGSQVPLSVRKAVTTHYLNCREILRHDRIALSSALACLFQWLQDPAQGLKLKLASAIQKLCSETRTSLVDSGPWLCTQLEAYAKGHRDPEAFERLFGSVSAIAQACTMVVWNDALVLIRQLLNIVELEVANCVEVAASDATVGKEHGLVALRCLGSMGMAFRAPEIEILDDEDEDSANVSNPWIAHPETAAEIRQKIMSLCVAVYGKFNDAEELRAICEVLKSGYTEDGPGPFVFPASDTLGLLQSNSLSHAGIGDVLNNCLILLKRNRAKKLDRRSNYATQCIQHIASQLQVVFGGDPGTDPEVAALVMDFVRAYIPDYNRELFYDDNVREIVLEFSVKCFQSHEILPKTSAAQFWSVYMGTRSLVEETGHLTLGTHAKWLTYVAAEQVCGNASRTELDCLSTVIRAVISRGGEFRNYLREGVSVARIESSSVTEQDRRLFVEKVLALRGGVRTRKMIEEFWAQCQGTFMPAA